MTPFNNRRWRWIAPGVVAAAIAATAVVTTSANASDPKLPARTAGELLSSVQRTTVPGFSGTVVQTTRLGLPELPAGMGEDATLSLQSFASGSRQLRIWQDGPDRQRVALLGQAAESDVVHNGRDLWTYSSATRAVTHAVVPAHAADTSTRAVPPTGTPEQAAQAALRAIDPTTRVTVDRTARVAGRAAYQLVLTPRDTRTLVGSVQIALDSQTSLPLRVRVFARGGTKAALEVGFTELRMRTPGANVFRFVPPAGTTVKQQSLLGLTPDSAAARKNMPPASAGNEMRMIGTGWTSVLVLKAGDSSTARGAKGASTSALLNRLTTPVAGGRLLTSALVSVLLKDDGTIYVGALKGADLQKVATTGRPL